MLLKLTAQLLLITMSWMPITIAYSFGDQSSIGHQGQAFGKSIMPDPSVLFGTDSEGKPALYPNSANTLTIKPEDLRWGSQNGIDTSQLAGDADAITEAMKKAAEAAVAEGTSSPWGSAYKVVTDSNRLPHPDMTHDPMWGSTDIVFKNMKSRDKDFSACPEGEIPSELLDKECSRTTAPSVDAIINHAYAPKWIQLADGFGGFASCGSGCFDVWIGKQGDNYWNGWCSIFEHDVTLQIDDGSAITSATITHAEWDDYMQIWLGGNKIFNGPNANFPPETEGPCELNTSWVENPGIDVTPHFQTAGALNFKIRVSVADEGEGFAKIRVYYDPSLVKVEETWTPSATLVELEKGLVCAENGQCNVELSCLNDPSNGAFSYFVEGVELTQNNFDENIFTQRGISPFCTSVRVKVAYNGQTSNIGQACSTYENDPNCGFVQGKCVNPAVPFVDNPGLCYEYEEHYQCHSESAQIWGVCRPSVQTALSEFKNCKVIDEVTESSYEVHVSDYKTCENISRLTECTLTREFVPEAYTDSKGIGESCFIDKTISLTATNPGTVLTGTAKLNQSGNHTSGSIVQQPSASNNWTAKVALQGPGRYKTYTRQIPNPDYPSNDEYGNPTVPELIDEEYQVLECPTGTYFTGSLSISGQHIAEIFDHDNADQPGRECLMDSDNFSTAEWICLDDSTPTVLGIPVTSGRFQLPELYPGEAGGSICMKGHATYDSEGFNYGEVGCWTDVHGDTHCPEVDENNSSDNTCGGLSGKPECTYVSTDCVVGSMGTTGWCYVENKSYDCGMPERVATLDKDRRFTCEAPHLCMGEECLTQQTDESKDFIRATAMLQAADMIQSDMNCANESGDMDIGYCEVFGGEDQWCKKAVGGAVDCCESPGGVSMGQYLQLWAGMKKLDGALTSIKNKDNPIYGAWDTLRSPVVTGWEKVTTWTDSVTGVFSTETTATLDPGVLIGEFKQKALKQTQSWLIDQFGTGVSDLFISSTKLSGGGEMFELGGQIGSRASMVMTAYMYYQIAVLIINIIWECEQQELELGVKRKLKVAHYVGSYCAHKVLGACIEKRETYCVFNSPLSRIMNEQVRLQLNQSWGTPENPNCDGLAVADMDKIDWNAINLDEWVGILASGDMLPDDLTAAADRFNMEALTGQGSALDVFQDPRDNAIWRTKGRIETLNPEEERRKLKKNWWGQ